jgi:Protein of unknown function (DUF2844)
VSRTIITPHNPLTLLHLPIAALVLAVTLTVPMAAHAGLGATVDSVARDEVMLKGVDLVTPTANYDLHEIKAASGTTVREYVSRQGTVFAVTWEGRTTPDLERLLGSSYSRYLAEARAHRSGHHLLSINTPDIVASVVRLQRSSIGHVHVPALVPAGVAVTELR